MFKNFLKQPSLAPVAASDTALAERLILEGNHFEDAGQLERACALYRQAIHAAPQLAKAHLNLGIALAASDDATGATQAYEEVLRIDPDNAFGNYNFARLAYQARDIAKAEALLQRSLVAKPDFFEALVLLSTVLEESARLAPASEALTNALRLRPDSGGAWINQAMLLRKLDRPEDAEMAIGRALAINPFDIEALWALSDILHSLGFNDEALVPLRTAIQLEPQRFELQSAELFLLNFDERLSAEENFQRHVMLGTKMETALPVRFKTRGETVIRKKRLRIGYVSSDFNSHPVSQFMIPVLEHHNHDSFEILCYSCGSRKDVVTEQIQGLCHQWTDANRLNDRQLADAIYRDHIDILVDLSGHSGGVKLAVFSERPAAVQATWLGYLNTSGLSRMDYRICDVRTDPTGKSARLHTETLAHLPDSQWCYRPVVDVQTASTAPFHRNGHITFGSFNSGLKISTAMCKRWAEILVAVPGSKLVIADVKSERKRGAIRHEMSGNGLSVDRVQFLPRMNLNDYFSMYGRVDIALDTYPYGGGTTTFDALWMGVPVLTASGDTSFSRSAASILAALGLNDWIAPTVEQYVQTAVQRACDLGAIQGLRQSLRSALMNSPLADERKFVQGLEACYVKMWEDYCERSLQ